MTDIELPEDTRKSRLNRVPKPDTLDDVATAGDRIEAFWKKHENGSILTEVESREVQVGARRPDSWGEMATVYTARVFVRKNAESENPDTTAHATRSTADPDEVTAAFPQETAETSAVSRALRNLGILAVPKKTRAPRKPKEPTP